MTRPLRIAPLDGSVAPVTLEPGDGTRDAGGSIPRAADVHGVVVGRDERRGDARLVEVVVDGWRFELVCEDAQRAELRERATRGRVAAGADGPIEIRAIIPGRVLSVSVTPGDAVSVGDRLLVIEAMKMQNELRAPREGTVDRVGAVAGSTVEVGDLLLVLH